MNYEDLKFGQLQDVLLKPYQDRAKTVSGRFLKWFLEDIFRLDAQDADDASVDSKHDKGIDAIYIDEQTETIYLIQAKIRQKEDKALGDKDLKEFYGSLKQFENENAIKILLNGNASNELKNTINRSKVIDKINNGFNIVGVFCTNIKANKDAELFLGGAKNIELYDAKRITEEHIEVDSKGGIKKKFAFDISDTDVIDYEAKNGVNARIFLASASDLVKLHGISDGKLFEQNVRLSLGNTKINKGLIESIKNTDEHQNFPLYHNGITILCDQFEIENDDELAVKNYVVVNGAQSITSLYSVRGSISDELKVLTKVIALKGDESLSGKITYNSNNQNAIKARDLRSNHPIQVRLQKEIQDINYQKYRYEVKRGEKTLGYKVISNEDAGLILLALDLGEPWSCHQ